MARLQLRVNSLLSSTSAEEKDIANWDPLLFEVSDALNEGSTRSYRVADAVSNQTLDLAGLADCRYILVRTTEEITLRINATDSVTISPPTGFNYGWMVLNTTGVTALDVSNASGNEATVYVQLAGDAT